MSNIKIYKNRIAHFCASSHHFRDIKIFDLDNVAQGLQRLQWWHSIANIKRYECYIFASALTVYKI